MSYRITVHPSVQRDFRKIDPKMHERLLEAIRGLATDPRARGSIGLSGAFAGYRRARVGSYRVIYYVDEEGGTVEVLLVGHRSLSYDELKRRVR
ncbi:MAG: type II toxin-antitoxin system RelE/ParE family toxin [Armatimonadia bacterium]